MKKIYAVVKQPGRDPSVQQVDDDLKTLQGLVGGYLEEIRLTGVLTLLCNEDGRRLGLQANLHLPVGTIAGTVLVVAHTASGATRSLTAGEHLTALDSLRRFAL
jgi:hypothetical protein